VVAQLYDSSEKKVAEVPLSFSGEVSVFTGEMTLPSAGSYLLEVVGSQPETRNFGRAQAVVEVLD
jgi:hypothetical protein